MLPILGSWTHAQLHEECDGNTLMQEHNCQVHSEIGKIPKQYDKSSVNQKERLRMGVEAQVEIGKQYKSRIRPVKVESQSVVSYEGNKYLRTS